MLIFSADYGGWTALGRINAPSDGCEADGASCTRRSKTEISKNKKKNNKCKHTKVSHANLYTGGGRSSLRNANIQERR